MQDLVEINLFDLDLAISGFKFDDYLKGEKYILTPALIDAGLFPFGQWSTIEGDEWGPLVRSITVIDLDGDRKIVWYG